MVSAGDLLTTADGREVYSYIVSCALPEDETLVAVVAGVTFEFPGFLGLAPQWRDHPLSDAGSGWVSACLFARTNAHDVTIEVSLRGPAPHRALDVSDDEAAGFTLEEGAFYGQYFGPTDQPIAWYACRGRDQAAGETGGLVDRDCAEPDPADPTHTQCGFNYAGDCADFSEPADDSDHGHGWFHHDHDVDAPHACEHFRTPGNSAFYTDCHTSSSNHHGEWPHHSELDQVITTFVTP